MKSLYAVALFVIFCYWFYEALSYFSSKLENEKINSAEAETEKEFTGSDLTQRLPQAIIIGSSECSTKTFLTILGLHPNIMKKNDVHFFDQYFHEGIEWYRQKMPFTKKHQITMEQTPGYFTDVKTPALVNIVKSDLKLILIVRNPLERALIEFGRKIGNYSFDPYKYDNASKIFETEILDNEGNINKKSPHINNGMYITHLQRWLKYFSVKQILVLDGERFYRDPYSIIEQAFEFLNLQPNYRKHAFYFDKKKDFLCIKKNLTSKMCFRETRRKLYPYISENLRNKIKEFYKPLDDQLFETIGKNPFW